MKIIVNANGGNPTIQMTETTVDSDGNYTQSTKNQPYQYNTSNGFASVTAVAKKKAARAMTLTTPRIGILRTPTIG